MAFFTDRQAAFVQMDLAGDATLDDQVLRGGDVADNDDVLSDKAAFGSGHAVSPVGELSRDGRCGPDILTLVRSPKERNGTLEALDSH
jgi:hypothetical protein